MRPLMWVSKSQEKLADELVALGHDVSPNTVGRLLVDELAYSGQVNRKTHEGSSHPDRNAQFEHINAQVKAAQAAGQPVICVDTKKKEEGADRQLQEQRLGLPAQGLPDRRQHARLQGQGEISTRHLRSHRQSSSCSFPDIQKRRQFIAGIGSAAAIASDATRPNRMVGRPSGHVATCRMPLWCPRRNVRGSLSNVAQRSSAMGKIPTFANRAELIPPMISASPAVDAFGLGP